MDKIEKLEQEIKIIKERNRKVEADKAWETSILRKLLITILTYLVIVIFFFIANLPKPFINSIVPTLGFILSTFTITTLKTVWIKYFYKNKLKSF